MTKKEIEMVNLNIMWFLGFEIHKVTEDMHRWIIPNRPKDVFFLGKYHFTKTTMIDGIPDGKHIFTPEYEKSWDNLIDVYDVFDNLDVNTIPRHERTTYVAYCDRLDNSITIDHSKMVFFEILGEAIEWYRTVWDHI